ncbi:MAG TPA: 16S rRNA (uracil(1498)-N(3))-methyltransferase [Candidatus Udaeobacter sp.]|nr:16S rRNA (uracil(1498)-N(3))-methyltransferase [Candidatus Udaeobacter sp.]
MARFFVPKQDIRHNQATVLSEELGHLRRVLRLGPGDHVTIFDDTGWEHEAVIRSLSADCGNLEILRSYEANRESSLNLILALGLTKGEKMDFVVEKATELGVQTLVPIFTQYTVPKFDEKKIARRTERWRKIALSASKQSGRTRIPEINTPCEFRQLINRPWAETLKLFFWEAEARQTLRQLRATAGVARSILVVIGPEGGFTNDEAGMAQEHGFYTLQLGRRVLRAETAAVVAIALVQFLWGDLR